MIKSFKFELYRTKENNIKLLFFNFRSGYYLHKSIYGDAIYSIRTLRSMTILIL